MGVTNDGKGSTSLIVNGKYIQPSGLPISTANSANRTIFLSLAGGWTGTTLPDGGFTTTQTSTNVVNFKGTSFAVSTSGANHEFGAPMPDNYNGGTVTAIPYFYTANTDSSSHIIVIGVQGVAFGGGTAMDTAYGTAQTSQTVVSSSIANTVQKGVTTSAITIAGSTSGGNWTQFRVFRNGTGSSPADTFSGTVVVLGIKLVYGTNAYSDD
jgi:hypothetical protein